MAASTDDDGRFSVARDAGVIGGHLTCQHTSSPHGFEEVQKLSIECGWQKIVGCREICARTT